MTPTPAIDSLALVPTPDKPLLAPSSAVETGGLASDLDTARFESFEWFQEELAAGRLADCVGSFVALCGNRVIATGGDIETVTAAALADAGTVSDRLVVTYAGRPDSRLE